MATKDPAKSDLRVFGYGSLMWNPGFPYLEAVPAKLEGWHRAFCVYSHHYRGTAERPGLVLGLDRGGHCQGLLFRVAAEARDEVLAYLRERELITHVYVEQWVSVRCKGRPVEALTYVADPGHQQYAGALSFADQVAIIAQAEGTAGRNRDYLGATNAELHRLGLPDPDLDALSRAVDQIAAAPLGDHLNVANGAEDQ